MSLIEWHEKTPSKKTSKPGHTPHKRIKEFRRLEKCIWCLSSIGIILMVG